MLMRKEIVVGVPVLYHKGCLASTQENLHPTLAAARPLSRYPVFLEIPRAESNLQVGPLRHIVVTMGLIAVTTGACKEKAACR